VVEINRCVSPMLWELGAELKRSAESEGNKEFLNLRTCGCPRPAFPRSPSHLHDLADPVWRGLCRDSDSERRTTSRLGEVLHSQLGWTTTRCGDSLRIVHSGSLECRNNGRGATYCHSGATILRRTISKSAKSGAEGQNRTVDTSLFRAYGKRYESRGYQETSVQKVTFFVIAKQPVTHPGASPKTHFSHSNHSIVEWG
jgi:hypothetical protein